MREPAICLDHDKELNVARPEVRKALDPFIESVVHAVERDLQASVKRVVVTKDSVRAEIMVSPEIYQGIANVTYKTGYLRLPGTPELPTAIEHALPEGLYGKLVEMSRGTKVLPPQEANGPDGYPRNNPAFDEAARKVVESRRDDIDAAKNFLARMRGEPVPTHQMVDTTSLRLQRLEEAVVDLTDVLAEKIPYTWCSLCDVLAAKGVVHREPGVTMVVHYCGPHLPPGQERKGLEVFDIPQDPKVVRLFALAGLLRRQQR